MSGLGAVLVEFAGAGLAAGAAIAFVVVAAGLPSADASDGVCCWLHPKVTAATGTSSQTASRATRIRRGFMLQTLYMAGASTTATQSHREKRFTTEATERTENSNLGNAEPRESTFELALLEIRSHP